MKRSHRGLARRFRDRRRSCIEISRSGLVKRSCRELFIEVLPGGLEIPGGLV